jgi:hypothetical protein
MVMINEAIQMTTIVYMLIRAMAPVRPLHIVSFFLIGPCMQFTKQVLSPLVSFALLAGGSNV